MSDFSKKIIKSLTITFIAILAGAVLSSFLAGLISKKSAEVAEKKNLAASFSSEQSGFSSLEADYQKIRPYMATVENVLPGEENLFRVVEAVENLAAKNGIKISINLDAQTPLPGKVAGARQVPFSAALSADYTVFKNFLAELDTLPIFVSVESFTMSGTSISSGGSINLKGIIYTK